MGLEDLRLRMGSPAHRDLLGLQLAIVCGSPLLPDTI